MTQHLRSILDELHRSLLAIYGARLDRLILYGSHARDEARPDSDIDILLVLRGEVKLGAEIRRVVPITADISLKHNVLISCAFTSSQQFENDDEPLLVNIRQEGILL